MYYKLSCPVPKEQRPINEYMELVQSNFFNWPILSESLYKKKIVQAFLTCFCISLPFSSLFFNFTRSTFNFILINLSISIVLLVFVLIRLLLSWNYIKQRLENPTIFYEESGWYDGRIWVKSKNILVQDRLIRAYHVIPAVKKLKSALFVLCCFLCSLVFVLTFN
jgi:hypothetical protein